MLTTLEYYIPKYLKPQELVDPATYELYKSIGNVNLIYTLFPKELLQAADWLRERYGAITVNNWHIGGSRRWSGLRTKMSDDYSPTSMHTVCQALDIIFSDVSAQHVRDDLKTLDYVPFIKRIENKVSWLHIDVKATTLNEGKVYFFKPY